VELNPSLVAVHQKVEQMLALISGIADFMRGGDTPEGELATVANIRTQALSMMVQDMQDRVADMMTEWAQDVDMLSKEFADKPTMIRITGDVGFDWQTFSSTDLQGQYEYQIVPGSLQPINRDVELKQRLDLLNVLAPFINVMETQLNGKELIRAIAELFPVKNLDKILGTVKPPPPADPAEENYLMQEGGSPVVSPEEDFNEHLQIHLAWLQQISTDPNTDKMLIYRLKKHIKDTQQMQMMLMVQQMMGMMPGGPMPGGPMPGGPGAPMPPGGGPPGGSPAGGPPSPETPAKRTDTPPAAPQGKQAQIPGAQAAGPSKPAQLNQGANPMSGYTNRAANTRNPPFPGSKN